MEGVVFVCNHERTDSWNCIAQNLKANNFNLKIIAVFYDKLAKSIIDESLFDLVINLDDESVLYDELLYLNILDDNITMASKDRELRYRSIKYIKNKFEIYSKNIESKLNSYKNLVFFGEVSWAAEEILYLYSKARSFNYYTIVPVRFINRRWAIVKALSEDSFMQIGESNLHNKMTPLLTNTKLSHPDYFYDGIVSLKLKNRFKRFLFINKLRPRIPQLFFRKILFVFTNPLLEFFKKDQINQSDEIIYLYAFQVQPEASIDYLAPEFINQCDVIDEVLANLKSNEKLALKEHPGETISWSFFKKIHYIFNPKVIFLKTKKSLLESTEYLDGAITITGTIGGELSMLGLPTVSLKKIYYNFLQYSYYEESISAALNRLRSVGRAENSALLAANNENFIKYIYENSFQGYSYFTKEFGFRDKLFINSMTELIMKIKF